MRFSINMCRGDIVDIINIAEENNLLIDSIEQGPINDEMINVKVKFSMTNSIQNIEKFVTSVKESNIYHSCELV